MSEGDLRCVNEGYPQVFGIPLLRDSENVLCNMSSKQRDIVPCPADIQVSENCFIIWAYNRTSFCIWRESIPYIVFIDSFLQQCKYCVNQGKVALHFVPNFSKSCSMFWKSRLPRTRPHLWIPESAVQYNCVICTSFNSRSNLFLLSSSASYPSVYTLKCIMFYYKLCSLQFSFIVQLKHYIDYIDFFLIRCVN